MIVHVPPSLQEFCDRFSSGLTKVQKELLPVLLTGILLGRGKRTQSSLAQGVKTRRRHKSSISRLFRRARFRTRDLVAEVTRGLIEKVSSGAREAKRTWVFILDITWHGFRHTGATLAADAGVPHRTIQGILGHGNSSTTDLYVHRVLESEQQAMDKMGEMFPSVPKLLETETGKMVN